MKLFKTLICSAVFLALTVIKIYFPGLNSEITHGIDFAIETETRHTEAAVSYGEKLLSGFKDNQSGMKCLSAEKRSSHLFAEEIRSRMEESESEGETEKEKAEAVAAFVSSQSEFCSEAIPQSVLLQIPELGFNYASPVEGIKSSGFGYRIHPLSGVLKFHYGTDFAADTGTEIKAFADGTVTEIGECDSYGKYITVEHSNGFKSFYAHCSEICADYGEVSCGDVIAFVGATGNVTGPHLHFELLYGDSYLNPEFYL